MGDIKRVCLELRECRTDYDGALMSDRSEPIGACCGLLRSAEEALADMEAELARRRAMTACTMGVGDGSGKLFVHGDYDSIKAAQALVKRLWDANEKVSRLKEGLAFSDRKLAALISRTETAEAALAAADPRYTITDAGRAALGGGK